MKYVFNAKLILAIEFCFSAWCESVTSSAYNVCATLVLKKVKLINHDCLPILILLYIMMYIVLAYLMLYIVLACLMRFAALSNAVCLCNASFLPMISANAFYLHVLSWFIDT